MKATAALVYELFKIRIGFAIMLSALAGYAVTPGVHLDAWQLTGLALAVLGSSAAAGAFNHYVERDLDARMRRTRKRPFVTGRLEADGRWLMGITLLLVVSVALAGWVGGGVAALYVFLGAITYGVVYTVWLKRRTAWNIVVGGLAGSFAVLAGAAAADPTPGAVPWVLAVVLFLWTPPHFWSLATALREDYAQAGVPMLPVVVGDGPAAWIILGHTVALVAASLVPLALGFGWIYGTLALIGGGLFIQRSIALVKSPDRAHAMANFHASLVQLTLVLAGAMIEGPGLA